MRSALSLAACWLVAASPLTHRAAAAGKRHDWPTVQHDFQRTGCTAVCSEPPWRVRWVWSNGHRVERPKGYRDTSFGIELLDDFLTVRFVSLVQPMTWKGAAYVGSVEGWLFAIDLKTGETRWKAKAAGPILHSVSIADDTVFVPTMRGVDAFDLTGKRLWHFEDRRFNGFWSSPACVDGVVLIGSLSGFFYAIDGKSGKERWHFRAGGPICHCPAVWQSSVFFGAEDMHAYCLDIGTGKQAWKSQRLHGLTFKHHWPVVAAKAGVVIFRTGATVIDHGDRVVQQAPFDYEKAQDALQADFRKRPYTRTTFFLRLSDGAEALRLGAGYVSKDEVGPAPIVNLDGKVLLWHWAKEGAMQQPGSWSHYGVPADLGVVDFQAGRFRRLGPTGTTRPPAITRNDDFHHNTLGGKYLFGIQHGLGWGAVRLDRRERHSCGGGIHYVFPNMGKKGVTWPGVRFALGFVGPTITEELILINPAKGVFFAALESATTK